MKISRKNVGCSFGCLMALLTALSDGFLPYARAGYVWTENASGSYSGVSTPWYEDAERSGKWVLGGTTNVFSSELNVSTKTNAADNVLTIDGAAVSCSHLVRVSENSTASYLNIQNGGSLSLTNTLSISDASGISKGYVKVDHAALNSTSEIRVGFHWLGYLDVLNGATVSCSTMLLGGGTRKGRGFVTIGGLDSETNTGSVTATLFTMGANGTSSVDLNRGTMNVGSATVGTSDAATETVDVIFNVREFGTLAVTNTLSLANHASKNAQMNVLGGTVSANRILLGDAAGAGTMNIENGAVNAASVTAAENIVVGNKGTGTLNLKSGTLLVAAVGETTTYNALYIGGFDEGASGTGVVNVSGGTLNVGSIYAGSYAEGTLNVTGGTIHSAGGLNIGQYSSANGLVNVGSADGLNVPTLTFTGDVSIGLKTTGTMNVTNGTVTAANFQVGCAAGTTGTLNLGSASSESAADIHLTGTLNVAKNGNGLVSVLNSNVTLVGTANLGASGSSTVGLLDIGRGGVFTIKGTNDFLRMGQGTTSGMISVHDGGQFVFKASRFLAGDSAKSRNYISVTGDGSVLKSETTDFCLGYHGTAYVTIANGGTLTSPSIRLGINNAGGTVPASKLLIAGKGSLLQTSGTLAVGNGTTQVGVLTMAASETGFGTVEAQTITLGTGSAINVGVDHSIAILRNYTEAGYIVLKTQSNPTLTSSGLWSLNTSAADGWNTTIATLAADHQQTGTLASGSDTIQIDAGLNEAGWINSDFGAETKVELSFTGLNDSAETQLLAEWLAESTDSAFTAEVSGIGTLTLFDVSSSAGVFVWDFSDFNTEYAMSVGLTSATAAVPEPAGWMLLLLGTVLFLRKKNRKIMYTHST